MQGGLVVQSQMFKGFQLIYPWHTSSRFRNEKNYIPLPWQQQLTAMRKYPMLEPQTLVA